MSDNTPETTFQPRIVAFVCKWCTYAGADLAGMSRLQYSPNVKTLMLPCSGRIDVTLVLRAFLQGADGVIVSGCHPGDCHYTAGNYRARRRWVLLRDLLDTLGFDLNRLKIAWISAAEGNKWAKTVQEFVDDITKLGPYSSLHQVANNHLGEVAPQDASESEFTSLTAQEPDPALVEAIKLAFGEQRITRLMGWAKHATLGKPIAHWFDNVDELSGLVAPGGHTNLARFVDEPSMKDVASLGIVARSSELRALNVLTQEAAIDTDKVLVFEVDDNNKFKRAATLTEAGPDILSNLAPDAVVGYSAETLSTLDRLMKLTSKERFAFWSEQASRCLRCYACRGVCPMCRCNRCYAEKNQPQWFPTASDGPGNLAWQIVRAFHLAGRCIGCGACQEACPANIPLNVLNAALAKSALRNFGHQAGRDPHAAPLQADFKPQDPESFIV